MRISDWSSDVCSSDLDRLGRNSLMSDREPRLVAIVPCNDLDAAEAWWNRLGFRRPPDQDYPGYRMLADDEGSEVHLNGAPEGRSEEHTSELQSLMRISYAVFCLKKKNNSIHRYDNLMLCNIATHRKSTNFIPSSNNT